MANEVEKVELFGQNNNGDVMSFGCANAPAILKGTILKLIDPRFASGSIGVGDVIAGICSVEKEAADGATRVSVWRNGIFEMKASGAIEVGQKVKSSLPANYIQAAQLVDVQSSYSIILGTALETATTDEVINVRVNL